MAGNTMSTKQKMTISLVAMALVCVAAIVGVIAVFSATRAYIDHGIGITYRAKEFVGTISASYKQANWATISTVTFDGLEQENAQKTLGSKDFVLSEANHLIIFEYTISNDSAIMPFNVQFDYTATTAENIKPVRTMSSIVSLRNTISETTAGWQDYNPESKPILELPVKASTVVPQYFYVLVEVDNLAENVTFNATFLFAFATQVAG